MKINGYTKNYLIDEKRTYRNEKKTPSTYDLANPLTVDKGTATHTTVYINQNAFDKILSATTHNNRQPDWEEIGCDGEKRWIVINGQRFECPLSETEKAKQRRFGCNFLDILNEHEKNQTSSKSAHSSGNIEALRENEKVVRMLHQIFDTTSFNNLLVSLTGTTNYCTYA